VSGILAATVFWLGMLVSAASADGADVVRVVSPAVAPAVETWRLQEVWRLGDDEDDPDAPLLGVISRSAVDTEGNVFLMDTQLGQVLVIGPDGEYLRTIGAMGEGPGEVQRPADVCLLADGTLGLLQSYPAKIVKLTREGVPAGSVAVDNPALNFYRLRSAPGLLVVSGQRNDYGRKTPGKSETYRFIASLDETGQREHVYLDRTIFTQWQPPVSDENNSYFPYYAWDLQADGTLVVAPERDRYHLEFFGPDGTLTRVVDRPFAAYRRTGADKDKIRENMSMTSNGKELDVKKIVLDTDAVFRSLLVLYDGSIWAKTCYSERDLPDGVFMSYDVLAADGQLVKQVQVVCPARRDEDAFGVMPDGRFIWIRNLSNAFRGMYPGTGDGDDEETDDQDDVLLEVIVLERAIH